MTPLDGFIFALREELKHYGELLALLDQQQDAVVTCQASVMLESVSSIHAQADVLQRARDARGECQRFLAEAFNTDPDTSTADLISKLPPDYRPLLEALVQENKNLLLRVKHRATQNQLLLSRAVQSMQALIRNLCPTPAPSRYNGAGHLQESLDSGRLLFELAG